MASDTAIIPEERGIETHGIERVSPETRTHMRIFDNFTMWLSANLVISTVALGALATTVFGLGFWDSVAIILIFNVLGVLPVAFFSTLGPRLGLRQMTISRFSFGWIGSIIMALFNVAACIGWSAVNVIVGGQLVAAIACGGVGIDKCNTTVAGIALSGIALRSIGILVIAIFTTLVSIYGYRYVHRYERFAWIPMAIIFVIMLVIAAPHMKIIPTPAMGAAEIAGLISFGGSIYGFATGWSSYAADYNVNQPEDTPASRVFWLTFLGVFIPCVALELLGLAFTTWIPKGGGELLAGILGPVGAIGTFFLILLALSVIANNIPNDYSLGLSMQVLGRPFQRVNRAIWTLIGAVVYVLIALLTASNFNETLSNFLLLIAYWLGPWAIILVLEHFVFRRGQYNVNDWNTPSRLPLGWAAIVSMAIGLVGVYLGAAQVYHVGLIANLVNPPYGMDVGFELGVVLAGISYFILRRIELNSGRERAVSTVPVDDGKAL
ncbi:MAG: cytosine permease [Chloroflexota bacterium]|nr:cytosine permease [Chloroflexota bacterium]